MVRVEPVIESWAEALVQGDEVFSARFGVPVEANWAGFSEVMQFLGDAARGGPPNEWGLHLVFDDDGTLVGNAGWKGAPVDGAAELGYAVAPGRQGRGIAAAAVRELLTRAHAAGLRTVIAHTLAEASPSTSVLERCGFRKVDELVGPDDDRIWRWEISLVAH